MRDSNTLRLLITGLAGLAIATALVGTAHAQTENVIYTFTGGSDGQYPLGNPLVDAQGNVFGTTWIGGSTTCFAAVGCGVVFELTPTSSGWNFGLVHTYMGGSDGAQPNGGVIQDSAGNLYVTATVAGNLHDCPALGPGCGTVDKFSPSSSGTWQETTLAAFNGPGTGSFPLASVTIDVAGNLYGTTEFGGSSDYCVGKNSGCGIVFKLFPKAGGGWAEKVLYVFHSGATGRAGGYLPFSDVALDAAGNVYGTTIVGGPSNHCTGMGCGVVYKLSPTGSGAWTETILHSFVGQADGALPAGGVILDAHGNVYGVAQGGGNLTACNNGCGTVFQLSPQSNGNWQFRVLHAFSGADGIAPVADLTFDPQGNLLGTTRWGGDLSCNNGLGCGTVFRLSHSAGGWQETVLHAFTNTPDGFLPTSKLALDSSGNIFGVTQSGGMSSTCCGTVFEIKP